MRAQTLVVEGQLIVIVGVAIWIHGCFTKNARIGRCVTILVATRIAVMIKQHKYIFIEMTLSITRGYSLVRRESVLHYSSDALRTAVAVRLVVLAHFASLSSLYLGVMAAGADLASFIASLALDDNVLGLYASGLMAQMRSLVPRLK